jgi:hypothetical protein
MAHLAVEKHFWQKQLQMNAVPILFQSKDLSF